MKNGLDGLDGLGNEIPIELYEHGYETLVL